jgi:hypothetical protein
MLVFLDYWLTENGFKIGLKNQTILGAPYAIKARKCGGYDAFLTII